ncbi:hypothetical protein DRF65_03540 [Chryseobacterium pennae]|uniref:DUF4595 domain-containing protein n=1 Tax=Chryseobacterium pennae TaxID=2258962 RepID=A0A3D9CE66_9FLAO|nr:hypothetical protein [Chryseobacterium pennae]REC63791.1 hypothetical protein DRF65_03540 [Chryseobacterium pennae]
MKKILLLAIPFYLFSSCSSDTDEPTTKSKKIIEVKQDGKPYYKFSYNNAGSISEITNYNNGTLANTTRVEYTNGLETKRSVYNSQNVLFNYYTFTYSGRLVTERSSYTRNPSTGQDILMQVVHYTNDASKPSHNLTGSQYYNGTGNLIGKSEITYADSRGSNITNVYNATGEKTNVTTTVKDNAVAWDKVLDPFVYQHEHNSQSVLDDNIFNGSKTGFTVEFTYDKDNYPLSAKYSHSNGIKYMYTFTWE